MKPVYIGAFLDVESQWRLLAMWPPVHPNVYAEHVTLKFAPSVEDMDKWKSVLGTEIDIYAEGEAVDRRGQAALVSLGIECANKKPHVTISTADGTKPVYSNELLKDFTPTTAVTVYLEPFRIQKHHGVQLRAVIDTYPRTKRI